MLGRTVVILAAGAMALSVQLPGPATAGENCPDGSDIWQGRCFEWSDSGFAATTLNGAKSQILNLRLERKAKATIGPSGVDTGEMSGKSRAETIDESGGSGVAGPPDPCVYHVTTDPDLVRMYGHDGAKGFMTRASCPSWITNGGLGNGRINYEDMAATYMEYAAPGGSGPVAPPPPPPPRAEDLAVTAIAELPVPAPAPSIGPDDPDRVIVHKPVWLWTDDPGELTATVSLLGVEVTAVARLSRTTWSMGESGPEAVAATVVCEGSGVAAPAADELPVDPLEWDPGCGYSYTWKSTAERTDGVGRWPIHVDADWDVTWSSNTGVTGGTTITTGADTSVRVSEIRTALVHGGN